MKKIFLVLITATSLGAFAEGGDINAIKIEAGYSFMNSYTQAVGSTTNTYSTGGAAVGGIYYEHLKVKSIGFLIGADYEATRTINSVSTNGTSTTYNSNQTTFSTLLPQLDVAFRFSPVVYIYAGANYSSYTFSNQNTAFGSGVTVNGALGYQGGINFIIHDRFEVGGKFQAVNANQTGNNQSATFNTTGAVATIGILL